MVGKTRSTPFMSNPYIRRSIMSFICETNITTTRTSRTSRTSRTRFINTTGNEVGTKKEY